MSGLLTGLALLRLIATPAGAPLAAGPEGHHPGGAPVRRLALQQDPAPAPPAPFQASDRWQAQESRALFWTGAGMVALSAALAAAGVIWLKQDGKPQCTAPPGTVCERLSETRYQGWITIGLAAQNAVGGLTLMWIYRDRGGPNVALSPAGIAGRF